MHVCEWVACIKVDDYFLGHPEFYCSHSDDFRMVYPTKFIAHVDADFAEREKNDTCDIAALDAAERAYLGDAGPYDGADDGGDDDKELDENERHWNAFVAADTEQLVVDRPRNSSERLRVRASDELNDWLHREQDNEDKGLWNLCLAKYLAWYKTKRRRESACKDPETTVGCLPDPAGRLLSCDLLRRRDGVHCRIEQRKGAFLGLHIFDI